MSRIVVANIEIEVIKKNIKNMYLSVSRENGNVRISAPLRTKDERIIEFALSKIKWIRKQKEKYENQQGIAELQYISDEIHYIWGRPYRLEVRYDHKKYVDIEDDKIMLRVAKDSTPKQREKLIMEWYRKELKEKLPELFKKWEGIIGVETEDIRVKNMKTRWGTCNIKDKRIWINLQLAKKPIRCLEYVIVHELVHLLEASHNSIFKKYMDKFLPDWRLIKDELNSNRYKI